MRFAASKRSLSTPREMRSFVYAASCVRNVSSEKLGREDVEKAKQNKTALCTITSHHHVLRSPLSWQVQTFCIVIVDNIVARFEAATVEI